jgi:hypothetical protein
MRVRSYSLAVFTCQITVRRHTLGIVGRVAARDSSRNVATVQDLFVALCEDSSMYGLFKTMKGTHLMQPYAPSGCA